MSDWSLDLIEIATLVYATDSAISRGGPTDRYMGARWHREFKIEMPVRDLALWKEPEIKRALEASAAHKCVDVTEKVVTTELGKALTTTLGLDVVVLGGSIGLADGYLKPGRRHLANWPRIFQPELSVRNSDPTRRYSGVIVRSVARVEVRPLSAVCA